MFFFSIPVRKRYQKIFAFVLERQKYTQELCPRALCHNIVRRKLDILNIPQNITLIYYIDDIILIKSDKQAMASMLDTMVRIWEINFSKSQ